MDFVDSGFCVDSVWILLILFGFLDCRFFVDSVECGFCVDSVLVL